MKDATLTDITCIEELLGKLIATGVFAGPVFNGLWHTYLNCGRQSTSLNAEMAPDERRKLIQECKQEQRSAIHLLRMMGTCKVEILLDQKEKLYANSLKFAQYRSPDFIIMKEAVLAFEKILQHQIERDGTEGVKDEDKKYMFKMIAVIAKSFGT